MSRIYYITYIKYEILEISQTQFIRRYSRFFAADRKTRVVNGSAKKKN